MRQLFVWRDLSIDHETKGTVVAVAESIDEVVECLIKGVPDLSGVSSGFLKIVLTKAPFESFLLDSIDGRPLPVGFLERTTINSFSGGLG